MLRTSTSTLVLVFALALVAPACTGAEASPGDQAAGSVGADQSFSLQPAEADALRRKVLVQCGLDGSTTRKLLPWYFHFAYAEALLEAGDARRAIVQLSQSIDMKPVPRMHMRTYGMWYTDYLPYFQLAEAHATLDNWPCAERAMQLSQSTGETGFGRIEPKRIHELQERIDRHAGDATSCDLRDVRDKDAAEDAAGG